MATVIRDLLVKLGVDVDTASLSRFDKVLGGIGTTAQRVAGVVAGVGVALGAVGVHAVGLAADMETSRLTMRLLVGDAGKAAELMDELIKRAAATPFAQADLIEASKRLLRLTKDNIGANLGLLDVLETMAAVNPTKSVTDAAEALLDATSGGGFERLKEFGITLRADDIGLKAGAAGYADAVTTAIADAVRAQTGGRDIVGALSQTLSGRISTFKDTISNTMLAIGEVLARRLGPLLDRVAQLLTSLQPRVIASVERMGDAFDRLGRFVGPTLERLATQIERLPGPVFDAAVAAGALAVALAPLILAGASLLGVFGPLISTLPAAISLLSTAVGAIASVVGALGFLGALATVAGIVVGALASIAAAVGPWAAIAAVISAAYLAVDEFLVTLRGGDSLMRRFLDFLGVGEGAVNAMAAEVSALLDLLSALGELATSVGDRIASELAPAFAVIERTVTPLVAAMERLVSLLGRAALEAGRFAGAEIVQTLMAAGGIQTATLGGAASAARSASAAVAPRPSAVAAGGGARSVNMQFGGDTINGVGLSASDVERMQRIRDQRRTRQAADQLRAGEL